MYKNITITGFSDEYCIVYGTEEDGYDYLFIDLGLEKVSEGFNNLSGVKLCGNLFCYLHVSLSAYLTRYYVGIRCVDIKHVCGVFLVGY